MSKHEVAEVAVKIPVVAISTFTAYMMNTFNTIILVLFAVMVLDYITGTLRGLLTKTLNSTIGLKGIFKKVAMLLVVGIAACIEFAIVELGMETGNLLVVIVICFFVVNEAISCLENAAQLGVPIPQILLDALEKLREVGGKERVVEKVAKKMTDEEKPSDKKEGD